MSIPKLAFVLACLMSLPIGPLHSQEAPKEAKVFFPAVEREARDSWRPCGHFPKCSRRTRPQLQVARAMSESLSIK
jgi:hypothetical protein